MWLQPHKEKQATTASPKQILATTPGVDLLAMSPRIDRHPILAGTLTLTIVPCFYCRVTCHQALEFDQCTLTAE